MTTVPPDDHLSKYCGSKKLNEQGKPDASAFLKFKKEKPDEPETYVSMDWLECLHPHHRTTQLQRVRQALKQRGMCLGATAMLAVSDVRAIHAACANKGISITIQTTGEPDDPSHTGIYRDLAHAAQVAAMLAEDGCHRMYPAVPQRRTA